MLYGKKKKHEAEASVSGLWRRLRKGLAKTRSGMFSNMGGLFNGRTIDAEALEEIENRLLMSDVGMEATSRIIESLKTAMKTRKPNSSTEVINTLRDQMLTELQALEAPLRISGDKKPFVVLVVGVNGVGKTTTIGKLAHRLLNENYSILLAAGDTFRAAAIEQIQEWGKRNNIPVIAQKHGADSAAVIYDALAAARARDIDVVIADTAGRLHNKDNLMAEMKKIRHAITKYDARLPVECMLILDAGTGQNAIAQAEQFNDAIGISGITLTKLDGSARGGIVFALADRLGIPLRFIGVGEQLEDLQPFIADEFVNALLTAES